jgi:hypothetical protein
MESISAFYVYTGRHIPGSGYPLVIVTAHDRDESSVEAEYFLLLSDNPNYLDAHRFHSRKSPSEIPSLSVDQSFVSRFAHDSAKASLQNYIDNLSRGNRSLLDYDATLHQHDDLQPLITLHLEGRHRDKLEGIQRGTESWKLQRFLQALLSLRIYKTA